MSIQHFCDNCGEPLKDELYYIGYKKIYKSSEFENKRGEYQETTLEELFRGESRRSYASSMQTQSKEICSTCFKIIEMLFTKRRKNMDKLKKELRQFEKQFKNEESENGENSY